MIRSRVFLIQRTVLFLTGALGFVALLSGCARTYNVQGEFNPGDPLRVAVLPFHQMVDGKPVGEKFAASLAIDSVPLLSSKPLASPSAYVEDQVRATLKKTGVEVVNPAFVRLQLGHHGFVRDRVVSVPLLLEATPAKLGDLLLADALLYGVVTDWDRSYYGLESVNTVGVELRLVRAIDGALLWSAKSKEASGRGLSGIPTGFSSLVLEPLKGLDEKSIEVLANRVVEKSFAAITDKWNGAKELEPGPVMLGAVAFSRNGGAGTNEFGARNHRRLSILALGSKGVKASACLLGASYCTGLLEGERGQYTGEVELASTLLPTSVESRGKELLVQITIEDRLGRRATKIVPVDDSRITE